MTAQNDLDRALGAWFGAEAAPAPPPEQLVRILEATRGRRPRPSMVANIGSHWIAGGSTNLVRSGTRRLRPALVIALIALLVLALAGGAVLVGSRLLTPPVPVGHVYHNELVEAPKLPTPMSAQALVTLADGRVLAIGDEDLGRGITALVYDPATGASVTAGPMALPVQSVSSSVQLRDGRVLILGDAVNQTFDPSTLRFAAIGPTVTPRSGGAAALLLDGRVLIAGGMPPGGNAGVDPALRSAELFDPDAMSSVPTGSIATPTGGGPMVTLPDGRVFMATDPAAEIYDPATGTFSLASTTSLGGGGQPIVIPDGRVVLVGSTGLYSGGRVTIFDPATRTFSTRDQQEPLIGATLLDDGRIFLTGLCHGRPPGWTGVFDPATGATTRTPGSRACRPTSTRLSDGRVLILGGVEPAVPTVQIFQ